jgi:hypothetical protein
MAVFDRVVVDVVKAASEVCFVTNTVLPIAALPDAALAHVRAAVGMTFPRNHLYVTRE